MNAKLAPIADKIAAAPDYRQLPDWQELLWDEIQYHGDLDTKQVDIVFGMVVGRWDKSVATPVDGVVK